MAIIKKTIILRPKKLKPKMSNQKPINMATQKVTLLLKNNKQKSKTIRGKLIAA